jgi:hypothetical protein
VSSYRCRTHPEQAVTWRGTGCPVCEADKRASTKRDTTRPTPGVPDWVRTDEGDEHR